jgi:hypothetical protein
MVISGEYAGFLSIGIPTASHVASSLGNEGWSVIPFSLFGLLFSHQLVKDAVEVVTVFDRQGKDVPQFLYDRKGLTL